MIQSVKLESNQRTLDQIDLLYQKIWNQSIRERLERHASYEGFKGFILSAEDGKWIGFIYGYNSLPGQFYHGLLSKELKGSEYELWLADCFEIVELAVDPDYRNQGLAKTLVVELLGEVTNNTAVLTTQKNNASARRLYESLGWQVLKEDFYPGDEPYVIMGKELAVEGGMQTAKEDTFAK